MMKTKLILNLTALLCVAFTAELHAQLPNAWQIDDNSTSAGSTLSYYTNLTTAQVNAATNNGWRFAFTSRMITDYGSANPAMFAIIGNGVKRYGISLDLNGGHQLVAIPLGSSPITLTADASSATNYHTHELVFDPATQQVTYRYDGTNEVTWPGQASTGQPHQVTWGSASSADEGDMNFHQVRFEILGQGVNADYNAGFEGNPAVAPSPTTQGWSRALGGAAIPEGPVSPDVVPLPPLVTTLAASSIQLHGATLNGGLHPDGLATSYFFEYGSTTNYGDLTPMNSVSGDDYATNVYSAVSGLANGATYHFRAVITNSFGMVTGADLTFTTLDYITTEAATSLTPNTATLNATVNPYGLDTGYYWEYGTTTNYGSFTSTNIVLAGANATSLSFGISGLSPGTAYHFRAVATNASGVALGADFTFTTTATYLLGYGALFGSVAWGDYDNDGLLDVLLTGSGTHTWRNTGNGFYESNTGLPDVYQYASAAWTDFDNDGRLDVLLAGPDGTGDICQVWRNTGNGFTNLNAGLPGIESGSVACGDFDNDGLPDILITGATNSSAGTGISEIWRNNGDGTFSNVTAILAPGLPGVLFSSVAWGDFDNDGRLDILLAGLNNNGNAICQIWRNTGAGFTNIQAGLPGVENGSVAWGDFDNDGKLDVALSGTTNGQSSSAIAQVWHNTGSGFTNLVAGLPGRNDCSVAWGDYDNDGLPDLLLMGYDGSGNLLTEIWRNTGSGFANLNADLPGNAEGAAALGDANNDGRLDVLTVGTYYSSAIYLNLGPIINTPPTAPSGLTATISSPHVLLSWNPASDAQTPVPALTYNLRVGTTPGGSDIVAPAADASGFRRVAAMGNQQTGTNAFLALPAGTYYWSVQAVDGAFAGGPFAAEGSFTVSSAAPLAITWSASQLQKSSATLNASVNPNGLPTSYYFEYGLTSAYGSFTPTNSLPGGDAGVVVNAPIGGLASTTYHFRIVAANLAGVATGADETFVVPQTVSDGLPPVASAAVAWGDYDRDGRLDVALAGVTPNQSAYLADVWHNTGNGFTNLNLGMASGYGNAIAWGDYNNDGNLDVLLTSLYPAGLQPASLELWQNSGSTFTNVSPPITALGSGSVAWGDEDNDGRQDLLISGTSRGLVAAASSQIWRNTGTGFTNLNAGLPGVYDGGVAWADFDNDGRLDFILTGLTNNIATNGLAQIWRNTGTGFTNVNAGLPGVAYSSVAWGDYDNDGRLDLLLAGTTNGAASGAICQVWHNTGTGFTNLNLNLPGVYLGTVAWGDYDNDGRLDILLTGTTNGSASGAIAEVWSNTGSGFTNLNLGLPGVYEEEYNGAASSGSAAFGDYDNDGRLDILLSGTTTDGTGLCEVWINNEPASNNVPAAPTGLGETIVNGQLQLHWNPATDAQTPSAGLSYNLRVGTTPGGGDIVSPEANSDGFRLLPALGNAQARTNAFLLGLNPGTTYYWSVQAVDTAFAGGPFAPEASFVMPEPVLNIVRTNDDVTISWQPSHLGLVLQESPSLSPSSWVDSPSGQTNPIVVTATNTAMFYRLFKP